jgi:transcriptional regulator with XRE-family HTH domain
MPRSRVSSRDAKAISNRFKDFARRRHKSVAALLKHLDVSDRTGKGWTRLKDPRVPDVPTLLRFARELNLSLDWLLLGEGPDLRHREVTTSYGHFLATIEAELRASERASDPQHFDEVWHRMAIYRTLEDGYGAILRLGVEGVRPLYRELLRRVQWNEELFRVLVRWTEAWVRNEGGTPEEAKRRAEELRALIAKHAESQEPALAVTTTHGIVELEPSKKLSPPEVQE